MHLRVHSLGFGSNCLGIVTTIKDYNPTTPTRATAGLGRGLSSGSKAGPLQFHLGLAWSLPIVSHSDHHLNARSGEKGRRTI